MKLLKLELSNYRNVQHATYEFDGSSFILGENRIGKTNILESISFVLDSGKSNSDVIPNFDIKKHVSVKATFDNITLEKVIYYEFVDSRGTGEFINNGLKTLYFVNCERIETAKEYKSRIEQALNINGSYSINIIKALSEPLYIGELCKTTNWKKVRDFLFNNYIKAKPHDKIVKDLESNEFDTEKLKKKYNAEISSKLDLVKEYELKLTTLEQCKNLIDSKHKTEFDELCETCKNQKSTVSELLKDADIKLDLLNNYVVQSIKNINNSFEKVKWQLLETTLKGEEKEKCEPFITATNTLWTDGSKSEQIITGIEIIENIKKTLKIGDLPILIDEGGELSDTTIKTRLNTNSQIVCVKVKNGIETPTISKI